MHIIKLHLFCALQKAPRNKIVSRCLHLLIFGPEVPAGRWEEQGNNRILRNSGKLTVTYFLDGIFTSLVDWIELRNFFSILLINGHSGSKQVHNKILSMDSVKVTVTYFLDVISFHQFLLLSISIELNWEHLLSILLTQSHSRSEHISPWRYQSRWSYLMISIIFQ